MVGEQRQAESAASGQDHASRLGERTRRAWHAVVAAQLHDERSDVDPWINSGWAKLDDSSVLRLTASGWLRLDALVNHLTLLRSRSYI